MDWPISNGHLTNSDQFFVIIIIIFIVTKLKLMYKTSYKQKLINFWFSFQKQSLCRKERVSDQSLKWLRKWKIIQKKKKKEK